MDLDADVWSELPFELMERVLLFLPVPDLCRLRTVSKESNGLICKSEFGATHGHIALRRRDASTFIVVRCTHNFRSAEDDTLFQENTHQTWCFFDLEAQRWYTFKDHLIHPQTHRSADAAMDDGLVCQFSKTESHPGFSIIVVNPIADTLRAIPSPPAHVVPEFVELNLVVDSAAQQFKVLLINHRIWGPSFQGDHGGRNIEYPLVSIFDSATNQWRSLSNPPGLVREWEDLSVSIVMFQGLVYACFGQISDQFDTDFHRGIWRCSPKENAWEIVNVDIYGDMFENVHMMNSSAFDDVDKGTWSWKLLRCVLFVSADRLFFMAWITDGLEYKVPWILKVTEITASGMARERLFEMSKSDFMDVLL